MQRIGWKTSLTALALVAAMSLAIGLFVPATAEATCYPWEYQSALVFERFGGCCSAAPNGGEYVYREHRRYRTPNCDWGPWQSTNILHIYCVQDECPMQA